MTTATATKPSPAKIKQLVTKVRRVGRMRERVENEAGLTCKFNERLMKMTNVRWHYGRLQDGMCHYRRAWELTGNTYEWKAEIKAAGFKWDRENKVWFLPVGDEAHTVVETLRETICRKLSK